MALIFQGFPTRVVGQAALVWTIRDVMSVENLKTIVNLNQR